MKCGHSTVSLGGRRGKHACLPEPALPSHMTIHVPEWQDDEFIAHPSPKRRLAVGVNTTDERAVQVGGEVVSICGGTRGGIEIGNR